MKRRCTRRTLWKIKEPQRAFASVAGRPQLTERARPGPQLDIAIVGAGTAGLAVSVFLSRAGHRCTVYEKADETELDKPKGAGLGLQPIGLTVLHKLGLLDNVLLHGHRIDKLFSQTTSDRTVLDLEYGDFRKELFGLGIHREALFVSFRSIRCLAAPYPAEEAKLNPQPLCSAPYSELLLRSLAWTSVLDAASHRLKPQHPVLLKHRWSPKVVARPLMTSSS